MRHKSVWAPAGLALLAWVGGAGCRTSERILVSQPFAPPSQAELALTPSGAYFEDAGARRRVLLEFPLPGARSGFPAFHVYLDVPRDADIAEIDRIDPVAARGFFIQEVGQLRGKSVFSRGEIRSASILFVRDAHRMTLELADTAGMRITGRARVERNEPLVRQFRLRHAADVALLASAATSQPTTDPATASRPTPTSQPADPE